MATAASFVGKYRFSGGDRERQGLQQAIEAAASKMSFLIRPWGRSKLRKTCLVPAVVTISLQGSLQGDRLTVAFDDRVYAATVNGPFASMKGPDGDPIQVRHEIVGGDIVQSYRSGSGERQNRLSRTASGELVLQATVTSKRLSEPMHYRLTFHR